MLGPAQSPTLRRKLRLARRSSLHGWRLAAAARWVLAGYILAMVASRAVLEAGIGKPAVVSLRSKDFPRTVRLKPKTRKRLSGPSCRALGGVDDPWFARYGGEHCGSAEFESRVLTSGDARTSEDQVARASMLHKVFASDAAAHEYFWRFWGLHTSAVVPSRYYVDVRDRVTQIGDEFKALYYSPELVIPLQSSDAYRSAHLQYVCRVGRAVVAFTFSGFPGEDAKAVNPTLARAAAEAVTGRIRFPSDAGAAMRRAATRALGWGNAVDAWLDAAWEFSARDAVAARLGWAAAAGAGGHEGASAASSAPQPLAEADSMPSHDRRAGVGASGESEGADGAAELPADAPPEAAGAVVGSASCTGEGRGNASAGKTAARGPAPSADAGVHSSVTVARVPNRSLEGRLLSPLSHVLWLGGDADADDGDGAAGVADDDRGAAHDALRSRVAPETVRVYFGGNGEEDDDDVVGVQEADPCATVLSPSGGLRWVASVWGIALRDGCEPRGSNGSVNMAVTIAIPLGLLAAGEVINSISSRSGRPPFAAHPV